jgi:V/A-type H+-transporting ATPase subunit C
MKIQSPLKYAFGIGKIRALENFLIKQEVFEEAIESSLNEALRIFAESDLYSDEILHVKDSRQLENVLSQELQKLKKLIQGLLLDKELQELLDLNTLKCAENILKTYPSEFLQDYLIHLIDMHNIKAFLRLYVLKEPLEKLEAILTCEGFIKKKDFLLVYSQDLSFFLNRLEYVHKEQEIINYAFYLGGAIQNLEKQKSFVGLEKAINDFLIGILKPAKYFSFGPEPLLAYYFAKANEINLIRMIILGKLNDVSKDLIKERLNSVYA